MWFDPTHLDGMNQLANLLVFPLGGVEASLGLNCVRERKQLFLMSEMINIGLQEERKENKK